MDSRADENARHAEVLSIVSHDIRAPLGVILAAVSELLDPRVGPLTDEQRALVQLVRRSSERLSRLAANVFLLKRISVGELALSRQPLDLRDLARRAIDGFERSGEIAKKPHVTLHVPGERVDVSGDAELLLHACTNVLANAVRAARSQIIVTVVCDAEDAAVLVEDDGPGIPADLIRLLLDPAARLDRSDGPPRGLGLPIVRRIIDAHGGVLTAETRLDSQNRPVGTSVRIGLLRPQL
jgi:signal transduction histidine kinase